MRNIRTKVAGILGSIVLLASVVSGSVALAAPSQVATGLSATAGNQQVTVGFTQPDLTPTGLVPTDNDTRRGYKINIYQNAELIGSTDACGETSTAIESCVVTSYTTREATAATLENGVAYTFKVIARWSIGEEEAQSGESSASEASTPYTNPDKPSAPTAVVNSTTSTSVDVTWLAPADNGESIDTYTVTVWNKLGTSEITGNSGCSTSLLTCTVSNLTLGSAYTFKVIANNSAGDSLVSDVSNAVTVVPGLPTNVSFTTGINEDDLRTVTVQWAAPLASAETITEYTVTATAGTSVVTKIWTTGALEETFTADVSGADLVLGTTYGVTVKAKNLGGYGEATSAESVTPSVAPGSPTNVAGTFSGNTATVTWTAPTSNGGETISEYTASAFASTATDTTGTVLGTCTSSGALTCQIADLVAGSTYKFAVKAKNNTNNYGVFSTLSSSVQAPNTTTSTTSTTVAPTSTTSTTSTTVAPTSTTSTTSTTTTTSTSTTVVPTSTTTTSSSTTTTVPRTKLSSSYGLQVKVTRPPTAGVIKTIEIALSTKKVTLYLATPTSTNSKASITKYVVELRPTKGPSIKKTIVVKPGQISKPSLIGKSKTVYYVVIVAYQKSGKKITWKGPKVLTK